MHESEKRHSWEYVAYFSGRCTKKVSFLSKMVYKTKLLNIKLGWVLSGAGSIQ